MLIPLLGSFRRTIPAGPLIASYGALAAKGLPQDSSSPSKVVKEVAGLTSNSFVIPRFPLEPWSLIILLKILLDFIT